MSTLWVPTNDPWRWRALPIRPELPSFRTKEDVIAAMWNFPDCLILPETEQQQDALANAKAHFKLVATWLEYRLLGAFHYRNSLYNHPDFLLTKPYTDLSVATLEFCFQVHQRIPESADTFEQLWGICKYRRALAAFRLTGYYDDLIPDSKDSMHKNNQRALQAYSQIEQGRLPEQLVTNFEPREHLTEILLWEAINFANLEPEDRDLKYHIRKYKAAWRHCSDLTLHRTKGFDPVQNKPTKPKRPRGRPPKGSRSRQSPKL